MQKRPMGGRNIKPLTPMQLETLTAFYYGEVKISIVIRSSSKAAYFKYMCYGVDITGRVTSLFRRGLIKRYWPKGMGPGIGGFIVFVTPAGIKEMEAIDA